MTTTSTPLQTIFSTLGNNLIEDAVANSENLLKTFFTNLASNPTSANVVAQGLLLAAQAPLTLPNLETIAIQQVAQAGLQLTALIKAPTV